MAIMHPNDIELIEDPGEHNAYEYLKALPESWHIFHSIRIKQGKHDVEIDFVVLIPDKGVLNLEVKRWTSCEVIDNIWYNNGIDYKYRGRHCSPFEQSEFGKRALMDLFSGQSEGNEFRSGVLMVDTYPNDAFANENFYVCGADLKDPAILEQRLTNMFSFKYNQKKPFLFHKYFARIQKKLSGCCRFSLDTSGLGAAMEVYMNRNASLLSFLRNSPSEIALQGGAGSGKTTLLLNEASVRLQAGQNVFLMCYNKNLAQWFESQTELSEYLNKKDPQGAPRLWVKTFHKFCRDFYKGDNKEELNERLCEANILDQIIRSYTNQRESGSLRFDALLVDEAQDLAGHQREFWIPRVIRRILSQRKGLILASDSNQSLYGGQNTLASPTLVELDVNMRNLAELADFSAKVLPELKIRSLPVNGAKIQIQNYKDTRDARVQEVQDLWRALSSSHTKESFVVLSPWSKENPQSSLGPLSEMSGFAHQEQGETWNDFCKRAEGAKLIKLCTVKSFKGLESLNVILVDVPKPVPPKENNPGAFSQNDCYVACTRAVFNLYIIASTKDAWDYFHDLKSQVKPSF